MAPRHSSPARTKRVHRDTRMVCHGAARLISSRNALCSAAPRHASPHGSASHMRTLPQALTAPPETSKSQAARKAWCRARPQAARLPCKASHTASSPCAPAAAPSRLPSRPHSTAHTQPRQAPSSCPAACLAMRSAPQQMAPQADRTWARPPAAPPHLPSAISLAILSAFCLTSAMSPTM